MFINQNLVAIIFKFINFFALIGIGFFVYKKYLKSDISLFIEQKEADYQNLLTQQVSLEHKQRDLDLLLKQEAILWQELRLKVDEWKEVITLEQEKQEKKQNELIAIVKKRNTEIFVKKENQRMQKKVIDAVVIDLEKSLSLDFKDSATGTDYLNSILRFMNEKIS